MASGADTREALIRSGLELNDELPLERIFAGITTAAVAARAGVTTGSFFHHFRNASEYAAALVRAQLRDQGNDPGTTEALASAIRSGRLEEALSGVIAAGWRMTESDPGRQAERRAQMHLFAHHRAVLPTPPGTGEGSDAGTVPTVGDVLRDTYRGQVDVIESTWRHILDLTEMRLEEPFDTHRLAVSVFGLMLGLEIVHQIDPESVDDHLFADATATLAGAASRIDLRAPRVLLATELGQEPDASPQARSGARRREETRNRIVEAAAGMFDDGWDRLSATDIGEAADVSTQTVINLFEVPRRVCAATFVRHLPAFQAAIDAAMPDRPLDALRDALHHLALSAATDPHPARAYLVERLGIRLSREFDLADDDVRLMAPFGLRLAFVVTAATGRDIGDPAVAELASTLVDTVLAHAIPRPGRSAETVELALRLLPPEVLARAGESGS